MRKQQVKMRLNMLNQ